MKESQKKVPPIILVIIALLVILLVILCTINSSMTAQIELVEKLKDITVAIIAGLLIWLITSVESRDDTKSESNSDNNKKPPNEDENTTEHKSTLKQQLIKIVLILILVIAAIIVIDPLNIHGPTSSPEPTSTPEVTSTPTPTESPSPTVQPTSTPFPTASPSLAEMLVWSNKGYNDVQKLKDSRTTESLDKYAIAHRNSGKIRQIDVVASTSQSEYLPYPYQSAIYYYTADGDLCFILLHNAGTKNDDLRFYVYDNTVIQFIDVDGTASYSAPEAYSDICERGLSIYHTACDFLGVK